MILIPKTFNDMAIKHYQLTEVREIITAYALNPCAFCDPCVRSERCTWCGNHFCRCEPIVESEEGCLTESFHPGCHEQDRAALGNPGAGKNG